MESVGLHNLRNQILKLVKSLICFVQLLGKIILDKIFTEEICIEDEARNYLCQADNDIQFRVLSDISAPTLVGVKNVMLTENHPM